MKNLNRFMAISLSALLVLGTLAGDYMIAHAEDEPIENSEEQAAVEAGEASASEESAQPAEETKQDAAPAEAESENGGSGESTEPKTDYDLVEVQPEQKTEAEPAPDTEAPVEEPAAAEEDKTASEENVTTDTEKTETEETKEEGIVVETVSAVWEYDGEMHYPEVKVTGLPEGYTAVIKESETCVVDVTAVEGVEADCDRLKIVNAAGDDVTKELKITKIPGKLKVTPKALDIVIDGIEREYDGTEFVPEAKVTGLVAGQTLDITVKSSMKDVKRDSDGMPTAVDIDYEIGWNDAIDNPFSELFGTVKATFSNKAKESNYLVNLTVGKMKILPATLKVTTQSAARIYNGKALTAGGKYEGLKGNDQIIFNVTGSQKNVGSSINTYEILWAGALESNYNVVEDLGKLTVNEEPAATPETPAAPSDPSSDTPADKPAGTTPGTASDSDSAAASGKGDADASKAADVLGERRGVEADAESILGAGREEQSVLGARRGAATGDENSIARYLMMMGLSASFAGIYTIARRRQRETAK